jgi:hypothetical protein
MIWIPICGTLLKQEVGTDKSGLYNKWTKCWILHSVLRPNAVPDKHGFGYSQMYIIIITTTTTVISYKDLFRIQNFFWNYELVRQLVGLLDGDQPDARPLPPQGSTT